MLASLDDAQLVCHGWLTGSQSANVQWCVLWQCVDEIHDDVDHRPATDNSDIKSQDVTRPNVIGETCSHCLCANSLC